MGGKGEGGQDMKEGEERREEGEKKKKITCQKRSGGCTETTERAVLQFKSELGQTQLHFVEAISGSVSYTMRSCCIGLHGNKADRKSRKPRFQLLL